MELLEFTRRLSERSPGQHRILPPLDDAELQAWTANWPISFVPGDLLELYRRANGMQFGVQEGSPEGYYRLLSLREVDSARKAMWGDYASDLDADAPPLAHWLAISEHQDGACYVVLDTDQHRYFLMDACGADLSCPIGDNVEELLDHIWERWVIGLELD